MNTNIDEIATHTTEDVWALVHEQFPNLTGKTPHECDRYFGTMCFGPHWTPERDDLVPIVDNDSLFIYGRWSYIVSSLERSSKLVMEDSQGVKRLWVERIYHEAAMLRSMYPLPIPDAQL